MPQLSEVFFTQTQSTRISLTQNFQLQGVSANILLKKIKEVFTLTSADKSEIKYSLG